MLPDAGSGRSVMTRSGREFYTRHPYPPPVDNLDRARDEWRDPNRHRAEYHLFWPHRPYRADLDILIAGCGTWQAAKYARLPSRCARRRHRRQPDQHRPHRAAETDSTTSRISRLQQLPIEQRRRARAQFDLIVCTGVLHHLADPDAGLARCARC